MVYLPTFTRKKSTIHVPSLKLTIALENGGLKNRNLLFQRSIFRCELLVSGGVGKYTVRHMDPHMGFTSEGC